VSVTDGRVSAEDGCGADREGAETEELHQAGSEREAHGNRQTFEGIKGEASEGPAVVRAARARTIASWPAGLR
jgi:hypothetical protein